MFTVRLITDQGVTEQKDVDTIEQAGREIIIGGTESSIAFEIDKIRHIDVFWKREA